MISISFKNQNKNYKPGELLSGEVEWNLSDTPDTLEVHLLWRTEGKGSQDAKVVLTLHITASNSNGKHPFEFVLPASPYSYHGSLMSILWLIEVVSTKSNEIATGDFYLSPTGDPIAPSPRKDI